MTNKSILGYLCTAFFFLWSSPSQSQETNELLSIYELVHLEEYYVMHDDDGKTVVLVDEEWKNMNVFSFIESAIFIPNPNYVDTFNFTPEQFPNLKSVQFLDLYFNQLLGISKFKNLQYLDIGSLNYVEHMRYSYVLNFPEEFWSLKKLQILNAFCSPLSDFSEKIQQLKSLKILNVGTHHGDTDQLIIPWSLLLMPEFCVLNVSYNVNQEEFDLFQTHAHFTVTNDAYNDVINQLKPDKNIQEIFQKEVTYEIVNNEIVLKNDTLMLVIPLTKNHASIDGTATLKHNNKIIQKRKYKSGVGHGTWNIQNAAGNQKRTYSHGDPVGRWVYQNPNQRIRNQNIIFKKSATEFRVNGRATSNKKYYKNFNHLYHFKALEEYIKQKSQ